MEFRHILITVGYLLMHLDYGIANDHLQCNTDAFNSSVYTKCISTFSVNLKKLKSRDECLGPSMIRFYSALMDCVGSLANATSCTDRSLTDQIFLQLHKQFFSLGISTPCLDLPDITIVLILLCVIIALLLPIVCTILAIKT